MLLRNSGNGLLFLPSSRSALSGNPTVAGKTGFTCTLSIVSCGSIRIAREKEDGLARGCIPPPLSESEEPLSECGRATCASMTSGKPRGNAALSGIFVLPMGIGILTAELKAQDKDYGETHLSWWLAGDHPCPHSCILCGLVLFFAILCSDHIV